jgi:hypothetical protein
MGATGPKGSSTIRRAVSGNPATTSVRRKTIRSDAIATERDLATQLAGVVEKVRHGFDTAAVRKRPHFRGGVESIADAHGRHRLRELRHEAVIDFGMHVEACRCNADLASIAELEPRQRLGRLRNIGVVKHDDRRMTAQFHGDRFMYVPAIAASCLPTGTEPVKETLRTTGDAMRCAEMVGGRPRPH